MHLSRENILYRTQKCEGSWCGYGKMIANWGRHVTGSSVSRKFNSVVHVGGNEDLNYLSEFI